MDPILDDSHLPPDVVFRVQSAERVYTLWLFSGRLARAVPGGSFIEFGRSKAVDGFELASPALSKQTLGSEESGEAGNMCGEDLHPSYHYITRNQGF